ncbi:MAG: TPM domain-containing protein [Clostridiales bacterium]|nr:TPM domain-containing protein [Clostridiales bacterium]
MARSGGGHSGGGRSGGGFSGGGSRSGGGHSSFGGSSRSGGSRTSFGGNSRSGSGMGTGGSRGGMNGPGGMGDPGRRGMNPPPPRRPRRGFFRFFPFWGGYGGGYYRGGGCGTLVTVFIILVVLVFVLIGNIAYRFGSDTNTAAVYEENISDDSDSSHDSSHHSESSREKLDTDLTFDSNCVLDETGLVDDAAAVGEGLEDFFDATGVQPYVYLKSYDSSLTTKSKMDDYAQDWYEDNIDNEGTFLLIYFEGRTESQYYFSYVCGYDIESVMDEDAIDILWDYVDEYWYSDSDAGDAILQIFDAVAEEIM